MTPPPTLTIHHPLPYLTEFTVSPYRSSSPARHLLHVSLVVGALAFLASKVDPLALWHDGLQGLKQHPPSALLPLLGVALVLLHLLTHTSLASESITPLPSLGLLLTSRRARLPFLPQPTPSQTLIPLDDVIDICINEGLRRWAVIGFMCVLRKGDKEESVVVVFEKTLPRTTMLLEVYHGVREVLWNEWEEEEEEEGQAKGGLEAYSK